MNVDETLAAIDAAVGCQQCGRPLDGSVSADFDSEECQTAWHAARASRLVADDPVGGTIPRAALEMGLAAIWEALAHVRARRSRATYRNEESG